MTRTLAWKPIVFVVLALLLGSCAGAPDVRWGQSQTTYNETAKVLVMYRAPCVDTEAYAGAGPSHPLCRVDDATWAVVYPIMQEADRCLKAADARIQSGTVPAAEDALLCAESALERLLIYRLSTTKGD